MNLIIQMMPNNWMLINIINIMIIIKMIMNEFKTLNKKMKMKN